MMDLQDRVVLITGGTGALGSTVTKRFLDEGSTVITTYLDSEEYETLKEETGADGQLTGYKVDVTVEEQVEDVVQKVVDDHGRIDVLLNLVGGWKGGKELHDVSEDTWDHMMELNLKSAFLVTKHVLPHMRQHGFGRIVSVGSKTGHDLPAEGGPYAIAKHGIEAFTTVIAKENDGNNVTANCILPSVIDTEANREALGTENVGKWVRPATIADRITQIISNAQTTGEAVKIYGGLGDD